MNKRLRLVTAALMSVALFGCSSTETVGDDAAVSIYVGVPLDGPAAAEGRGVEAAARAAYADAHREAGGVAVRIRFLDSGARGVPVDVVKAAANARTAAEDSTCVAYVGELDPRGSLGSVPITNAAGILQVSPGPPSSELLRDKPSSNDVPIQVQTTGTRTFAALAPSSRFDPSDYGYEAMASVLAAIGRAENPADRGSVRDAFFDGTVRDSRIGRYSITALGETSIAERG